MQPYEPYIWDSPTWFKKNMRVCCVPKGYIEDNLAHSTDGTEARVIAKDLLYKFNVWARRHRCRPIAIKKRLDGYVTTAITHKQRKDFMRFLHAIDQKRPQS